MLDAQHVITVPTSCSNSYFTGLPATLDWQVPIATTPADATYTNSESGTYEISEHCSVTNSLMRVVEERLLLIMSCRCTHVIDAQL